MDLSFREKKGPWSVSGTECSQFPFLKLTLAIIRFQEKSQEIKGGKRIEEMIPCPEDNEILERIWVVCTWAM